VINPAVEQSEINPVSTPSLIPSPNPNGLENQNADAISPEDNYLINAKKEQLNQEKKPKGGRNYDDDDDYMYGPGYYGPNYMGANYNNYGNYVHHHNYNFHQNRFYSGHTCHCNTIWL